MDLMSYWQVYLPHRTGLFFRKRSNFIRPPCCFCLVFPSIFFSFLLEDVERWLSQNSTINSFEEIHGRGSRFYWNRLSVRSLFSGWNRFSHTVYYVWKSVFAVYNRLISMQSPSYQESCFSAHFVFTLCECFITLWVFKTLPVSVSCLAMIWTFTICIKSFSDFQSFCILIWDRW